MDSGSENVCYQDSIAVVSLFVRPSTARSVKRGLLGQIALDALYVPVHDQELTVGSRTFCGVYRSTKSNIKENAVPRRDSWRMLTFGPSARLNSISFSRYLSWSALASLRADTF